jgi:hypothetical protein
MSELFNDIVRHRKVNIFSCVILFQVDATIEIFDGIVEVLEVVFTNLFDTKVIDRKVEPGGVVFVVEEAWGVRLLIVAMSAKALFEEFVCKDPGLRKAVHAFANFHVDVIFVDLMLYVVMVNYVLWEKGEWHVHVFEMI